MGAFDDLIPAKSSGAFDDLIPRQKERGLAEKIISFATMGHLYGEEGPKSELGPEGESHISSVPSGTPGFFEDPLTALSLGGVAGARAASGPIGKLLTGLKETAGWVSGGVTDIPKIAKSGVEAAVKAKSAKPLAEAMEKRQAKGVMESITPEARIAETGAKVAETAPKVVSKTGTFDDLIPETKGSGTFDDLIPKEEMKVSMPSQEIAPPGANKAVVEPTVTTGTLPSKSAETGAVDVTPLKGFSKSWQEFWKPTSTLPQSEEYLKLRYKQFGDLDRIEGITKKMFDRTKDLEPDAKRDLFRFLDGQIDIADLPENLRSKASMMRTVNNTIGKMLVDRGMLDEKTFAANKGQYVRYLYLKHILGDKLNIPASGRLDLKYLKTRKDLTAEERKAIGLVEDVSVAEPVGISGPLSDISKHDFMEAVSKNPDWTWTPSYTLIDGQEWSIGKLADELNIQRKMLNQAPDVPEIKERLSKLETAMNEAQSATKNIPDDFVQLPNSPNYGKLQGAFVRKEIARDIQPVFTGFSNKSQLGKLANGLLEIEEKGMTAFKVGKTALNPPTMARNAVSNMIQLNMSGMNLPTVAKRTYDAAKEIASNGLYYKELRRNGGFKTNWGQAEIGEVLDTLKTMQGDSLGIFSNINKLAKYYGKIDDVFRLAKYIDGRKNGLEIGDATIDAQKWVMDYSLAAPAVKMARRYAAPFLSYQYKIAPLVVESLKKRPWVIAKYAAIPYLMQQTARETLDLTDEDWNKLKKELPLYVKENESYAVLPWKSPEGKAQWVNLEYYFPWQNFMAAGRNALQGKTLETVDKAAGLGNPFLDIYTVIKTTKDNDPPKDPYSGRPIYNQLDSPTDKAVKVSEWLYNKWAPTAFTQYGALGYTYKAATGEKDKYGRTASPGQAAGRWLGFNVVTPSPQQTAKERDYRKKQLAQSLSAVIKDPTKSKQEKEAAQKNFITEMNKLREAINN